MSSTRCHLLAPSIPQDSKSDSYLWLCCAVRGAVSGCPRAATPYRAHAGAVHP